MKNSRPIEIFATVIISSVLLTAFVYAVTTVGSNISTDGNLTVSGNVGIGTTSPYSLLSISNSVTTAVNTPLFTIASTTAGTATSTLMTVLANGYVGIGTASPVTIFQVNGTQENVIARFNVDSSTAYNPSQMLSGGRAIRAANINAAGQYASLEFATGNSSYSSIGAVWPGSGDSSSLVFGTGSPTIFERMRISNGGNVGIGTTSPYSKLSVWGVGTGATSLFELTNNASTTLLSVLNNGNVNIPVSTATTTIGGGLSVAGSSGLTVLQNGNVGIGTTSPEAQLHIFDSTVGYNWLTVEEDQETGYSGGAFWAGASNYVSIFANGSDLGNTSLDDLSNSSSLMTVGTGGLILTTYNSAPIIFATGGYQFSNERMRITTTGNVGIGTTTPTAVLQATASAANATTTMEIGKSGQNKGTCLKMYDAAGTLKYVSIQGGSLTVSDSSCQ